MTNSSVYPNLANQFRLFINPLQADGDGVDTQFFMKFSKMSEIVHFMSIFGISMENASK